MTIGPDPFPDAVDYRRSHPGPYSKSDILSALNLDPDLWPYLRDALSSHPDILTTGQKKGARHHRVDNEKEPTTRE